MSGFMLAHGGDASGFGMLAFLPVGLLLLVGLILVLRPTMSGTGLRSADDEDDELAQDQQRERGR